MLAKVGDTEAIGGVLEQIHEMSFDHVALVLLVHELFRGLERGVVDAAAVDVNRQKFGAGQVRTLPLNANDRKVYFSDGEVDGSQAIAELVRFVMLAAAAVAGFELRAIRVEH